MTHADPEDPAAQRAMAEQSFWWFCRRAFQKQRGYRWQQNWHHEHICARLEAVFHGRCRRLIISIPPRYSKTEIAVVSFASSSMRALRHGSPPAMPAARAI
jgi:hypothetical protein